VATVVVVVGTRDGGRWAVTRIYPAVVKVGGDSSHPPPLCDPPPSESHRPSSFLLGGFRNAVPLYEPGTYDGSILRSLQNSCLVL
jgi:hypothetical protein